MLFIIEATDNKSKFITVAQHPNVEVSLDVEAIYTMSSCPS